MSLRSLLPIKFTAIVYVMVLSVEIKIEMSYITIPQNVYTHDYN